MVIYLATDFPMLFIEDLSALNLSFFRRILPTANDFYYTYLHFPILFFKFFILSLYSITEIPRFKNFFINKPLIESGINEDTLSKLKTKFETLMAEEQLFLNNGLTADSLSKKLEVDKSVISKFLRENYNKGFNLYINELRIQEFKRLLSLEKYENYDLVGLAMESGFKSKSTFYRVFKDIEGITPSEYKKSLEA